MSWLTHEQTSLVNKGAIELSCFETVISLIYPYTRVWNCIVREDTYVSVVLVGWANAITGKVVPVSEHSRGINTSHTNITNSRSYQLNLVTRVSSKINNSFVTIWTQSIYCKHIISECYYRWDNCYSGSQTFIRHFPFKSSAHGNLV